MIEHDELFACMGTTVRLIICSDASGPEPALSGARARRYLEDFDRRLSRFDPASELSMLNADPRPVVPASPLLCAAIAAGLWAADHTGGIVDPVMLDALCSGGYSSSLAGTPRKDLHAILAGAPARRPARPDPEARWQSVQVDPVAGVISRPPGTRLDTGGTGKGLAADAVANLLEGHHSFVVDCGGDIRIGGTAQEAVEVEVLDPLTGATAHSFTMTGGGVASSGIDRRVWQAADGDWGHHLIDPCTGRPAWTGLAGVTALAPTALEADVLAKAAFLAGADGAHEVLRRHGGILFTDDGRMRLVAMPIARQALHAFTKGAG